MVFLYLFIPERVDGIQPCRLAGGVDAEEEADADGKGEGDEDGQDGDGGREPAERADCL